MLLLPNLRIAERMQTLRVGAECQVRSGTGAGGVARLQRSVAFRMLQNTIVRTPLYGL
jgi:hypothetical protein